MSKKISGYQLAIILYLCRSYTTLTHRSGEHDLMIVLYSILFGIVIQLLFLIPAYFLYKRYQTSNIITISKRYSGTLALGIAIITSFFCLFIAFDTFTSFCSFMTSTVFPYANQISIVLCMFIVVLYGVIVGFNPLLRASELIFPFTLIVFFIILGFAIKDFNPIFLKPILNNPVQEIFKNSILISLRNFELIPLVYLIDRVNSSKKSTILGYIIFFSLIHEVRILTILLTLGDYGNIQLYPSYALAALVEASIFQRLDSIYTVVWVLMAFIKLALYLWLSLDVLKQTLQTKYHPYLLPVLSILLVGATLWKNTFYTTQALKNIYFISTGLFVTLLLIVPILLLTLQLLPSRRAKQ